MPSYKYNGNTYDIPADKVADFEAKYQDATMAYKDGDTIYDIPVSKREKFLSKYPNAIQWDDQTQKDTLETNLADFSAQYGDFMSEYESFEKHLKAPEMEPEYLPNYEAHMAQTDEYNLRRSEREKMLKEYFSNPIVIKEREGRAGDARLMAESFAAAAGRMEQENPSLARKAKASNAAAMNPRGGMIGFIEDDVKQYNEDRANYETARRFATEAQEIYAAPSKYDESIGVVNFLRGAKDVANNADFWTMGMAGIADNLNARDALVKVQEKLGSISNLTEDNIDQVLSPSEKALVTAWATNVEAQARRAEDLSRGYQAGQGATESLGFMAQFLLTGGVGETAAKGATAGMKKWLAGQLGKMSAGAVKSTVKGASKGVLGAVESITKAAVQTPLMPSTYSNISEVMLEIDNSGKLIEADKAFWNGLADSMIETWSENAGGMVEEILGVPLKLGKSAWNKALGETSFGKWGQSLTRTPAYNLMKQAGWNGYIGELGEEWLGNSVRTLTGLDPDALKDFATVDQQLITMTSFAPMAVFGLGASTAQYKAAKNRAANAAEALSGIMKEAGYTDEQIRFTLDDINASTPRQLSETLTPVVNQIARDTGFGSDAFKAAMKYADAMAKYRTLDGFYQREQESKMLDARTEIESKTGQLFYQIRDTGKPSVTGDGNVYIEEVRVVENSDGSRYFVVGQSEDGTLAAVDEQGGKRFITEDEITRQLENGSITSDKTMMLRDFLNVEVVRKKQDSEQIRMAEDARNAVNQIKEIAHQGVQVNVGTVEAPVPGVVLEQRPDGIIVQTEAGVSQLSWEEAGRILGVDATPRTDDEIEAGEVAQIEAAHAERETRLAQTTDEAAGAEIEALDAQAEKSIAEPLPLKADGSVDQTSLWNQNPERWAEWNDEQRQDGGVNSLGYINSAISREQTKVNKLTNAYNAEPDFDVRSGMEQEIKATNERLNRLVLLQQKYAPLMQAEVQQTAEVTEQPAPVVANKDRERSVESVVATFYDKGLDDTEVSANIDANIEKYQKQLDALSKKAPKMEADADAYLQKKQKHQEKLNETQQELDFWTSVRQALSGLQENQMQIPEAPEAVAMENDPEPQNAVEFAARELGLKEGGIKLLWESFQNHTGYSNAERRKFFGLFKSKQDGGMTLEEAGERLMQLDRENNTGFFDQNDPNAGLNAILDALGANQTIGELRSYTARKRQEEAQREADAAYSAMIMDYEAAHGMSAEEVAAYDAVMNAELIQKALNETEYNELNSIFAEEISEYDTRTEEAFGRSDGEVPSDVERGGETVPEGSDNVLQSSQSDYTTAEGSAPEGEQSSQYADGVLSQDGNPQVQPAAVESSLDEDMPDFDNLSDEEVVRRATELFTTDQEKARLDREKIAALRERIKEWEQKLGVQVYVMENLDDVTNSSAREQILDGREVYGWFDVASGKVVFYLPDFAALPLERSLSEIDKTYIHEVVSHKGLRGLLGEDKYGELCDMVWDALSEDQKNRYLYYPGVNGNTRAAADEFIAHFAENVDYNNNRTLWDKIVDFIKGLFNSVELPVDISNESLADLLRMSYSRLAKNAAAVDANSNQQAEGNTMFRAEDGSLVGMHNISEEKLKKVIRQGGSANPSTAVIDIDRQMFGSYGEISFIMPSSLVDAGTGRNVGTFTADAWTPTYPQVSKRFSDDKLQRAYWRDISAIPEEMQHEVRMAFDSWLDFRNDSGLAYMFLQERGEAPEMVRVEAKFPQEIKDKVSTILGEGRTGLYELSAEEKQAMLELYIQENFGGNREEFDKSIADRIQRIEDRLSTGKVPSFVEKRITLDLQWMKEHAYNYDELSKFVSAITADIRHAGEVNDAATTNRALDYIKDNGLEKEFDRWKESLNDRYGIKEYLFDGYTPSGNQRWLPNTVENASRLMNKQGLAGATGMAASFNRFVATLAPKKKTLSDIRASKDRLVEDEKLVDDFREKWSEVFFDLGVKCQPDAKGYEDYGLARLTEAAQKKNPGAYLKKEYGVELSQEDLQKLSEMIKAIKTEFPARYFETKFQRPVYLNEFAAAVMPTTTSEDIKQAVSEAGLPIFEYDSTVEGSRKEATLKATEGEGIRFRMSNENQAIFVSNAAKAVEGIKQEKATPEQWLKMIEKNGGLKAGEDKWMGLSDWLKASDKKTLTKAEVLDFINENMIIIEEQHYSEDDDSLDAKRQEIQEALQAIYDEYVAESEDMNDDMFMKTHYDYAIQKLADELGYTAFNAPFINNNALVELDFYEDDLDTLHELSNRLGLEKYDGTRNINDTRLSYTSEGLTDRREIALTIPTIEPWNRNDELHFGDAGDGRAVAWVRFGETEVTVQDATQQRLNEIYDRLAELEMKVSSSTGITREEYEERSRLRKERDELQEIEPKTQRVLVIDEIQSKRHQEGREKGYRPAIDVRARLNEIAKRLKELGKIESTSTSGLTDEQHEERDKLLDEEIRLIKAGPIPDAPFDKNWHELAMKRMLRYAAENGYDVIAWTKGDQQAERYNIGSYVSSIEAQEEYDGNRDFGFYMGESDEALTVTVDENGTVVSADGHLSQAVGRPLADLVGKEMAVKMMQMEEYDVLEDTDLKVGNEGMKGFYDKMLPAFMNKYGKKWGVKVEDIDLPNLGNSKYTMHSVPVTEEMKASVMEGQVMFRVRGDNESALDFHKDTLIDFKRNFNTPKPTTVVDVNDRNAVAEALGYTPEEFTDKMYQQIIDGVNDGGKSLYDAGKKRIAIFAIEDSRRSADVEENIFHENTHGIIAEHPELLELGEWLWENSQPKSRQQIKQSILDSGYYEGQYHNEMLSRYTGLVLAKGMAGAVMQKLPADQQKYWELILNEFGYEPEREDGNRRRRFESDTRGMGTPGYGQERQQEVSDNGASETRFRTTEITPEVQAEMDVISATALMDGTYLKAPNGADTNLTAEQWALVRTKNFKAWFGDWENDPENASKVVDENGEPKVVYHGTNLTVANRGVPFWTFYEDQHFGTRSQAEEMARAGWPDAERKVYETFLNIRNIKRVKDAPQDWILTHSEYWEPIFNDAKAEGYDGLVYQNDWEDSDSKADSFVVFDPSQIKSATDNTGEFSEEEGDIRFRVADSESKREIINNTEPVDVIKGAIAATDGESVSKAALRWFEENVGKELTYNTEVGTVTINRRSVKNSLAHGYSQTKLDAITSLPEGFGRAVYLASEDDFDGKPEVNHYFVYPINYDGSIHYVLCRVKSDVNKSSLYIHEVFPIDAIKGHTLQTAADQSQPHRGISLYLDLLKEVLYGKDTDNLETTNDSEENISLRVNENPTEAQKEAGNYKMGHINLDGYRITIENPKGSVRRGTDSKGNAWENTMNNDYGYIRGTEGVDGDHIDVYLSDNPSEGNVFVVDQVNPQTREFDEHKVMYGFNSAEEAREAYLANFSEGWNGLGTITEVSKDEFKKWIQSSHRKTKPFSEYKSVKAIGAQSEGEEMEDYLLPSSGTPTDEVVASGLNLSPAQTAELAGNIFAALPEDSRKKITDGLNGDFLGIQDAILQIPASLAMKEEWDEEDRATADIVASEVTKMAGDMTRPFSAPEALWVLYNELNKSDDLISQASRVIVQRNLGFDKQTQDTIAEAKDGVRFRTVGDANINATASMYNKGAVNVWTRLKESYVDMHASIEELVKAIEKASGKVAQGFENILMALNQQSSKGLAAMESYEKKFLEPMYKAIRNIMDATDFRYEDIVRYVILKHGLERNEKMAQRDAREFYRSEYEQKIGAIAADKNLSDAEKQQKMDDAKKELDSHLTDIDWKIDNKYKELRERDYSGLTSMFYRQLGVNRKDYETEEEYQAALMQAKQDKYATLADVENAAEMEVLGFEKEISTTELWERINKATKETLRQQYESNMISKDQYETLRDMFQFYVPLRGFKDNTAEDMYTYYRKPNSTGYTKPILGAEGRKTEAESPFGWIAAMAGSAIASNVKNEAKLALYYFVSNRPDNGVATISRTWFVDSGEVDADGKKIFKPAYPPFTEDLSSDAAKAAYEQWQDNMRQLRDKGQAYESGQRLNLGNAVVNISDTNKPEHIVNVKVGGKDYTILINGNPRAAQAINGDLNIEATASDYSALFGPVLRWMSSVNTSYNPEFWITNMMRDMAFTMMAVNIKEDPAYRRKFKKNYAKAFKVISLVAKNEKGTIGDSYIEQQYKDFVKYGGVTGYTQIKDNETWEKEIESYLSSNDPESIKNGKIMKGIKGAAHAMHRFGESLEQVSRFAAFLTARETGKSINEAINDAKEITVNFNRKGSGKMITLEEAKHLTDKHGRPLSKPKQWMAVALSSMAPLGRRTIMFFNAAIQGLNATYKLMKKNPGRFAGWALGYAAVGMMNAVLHAMLDDDDDYLDIPQYERRNSLMIGGNGAYFKWALPQEARAFYALGDLAVETVMGRNPHQSVAGEAGKIMTEILPINPAEGWKAFMPSVAIPFIELALNEDYKGDAIYYDQKWLSKEEKKRTAKWSSAAQGTGAVYKTIAKGLNFATGGDEFDAGWINIQPEKIEHLVQSAFGGTIRTADKFVSTILAAIDPEEDVTVRQFPFLNRFLTINDERYRNVHVNDVFEYYEAEALHARTLEKKYNKARDAEALKELRQSDEYKWAKIYDKYKKPIKNVQEKIKVADGTEERKDLMKQQDELKKRMIKEISELE